MNLRKYTLIALVAIGIPLLFGCGGGGGGGLGSPDKGFDPTAYTFKAITTANTASLASSDVRALAQASSTPRLYAGTGNGLFLTDPSQLAWTFTQVVGLPAGSQAINALLFAKNGSLWVGTDNGLFTMDIISGTVTAIASFTGAKVLSLAEQGTGVYWVGLASNDASTTAIARSANGTSFTFFGKEAGMTASSVVRIFASDNPNLVVACGLGQAGISGLFRFKTNNTFQQIDDSPFNDGATFFRAIGSTYYAGGPGMGVRYQSAREGEWKTLLADITPYNMELSAYQGAYRTWIGADTGLYLSFDLTNFKKFTQTNGLASNTCQVVDQGGYGTFIGHAGVTGGISIARLTTD